MAVKKLIAICQSGGEFMANTDGVLNYKGGDAHAIEIDDEMKFLDLKVEVADMYNCNLDSMSIKYFLPGNKKTLISIANEKDLKNMIKFHEDSGTAEIYVMTEEIVVPDISNMPDSRSSRTTLSDGEILVQPSENMMIDVLDDINEPDCLFDATFDVVGDANHGEIQIDVPIDMSVPCEMPLPINFAGSYDEKHAKVAQQWQNSITGVGQRFNNVHEFREVLRKYSIAHQFAFKYKKNDSHRVTVTCKEEGCPWRIHASRLTTTPLICIKKMNSTHTCEGSIITTGSQVTRSWVASIIKEKLKVSPNYKPKDIVNDIKEEYGIELNYFQAWRGKEIAKEQLQGSYKESYRQLPFFCENLMQTNPGSLATFTTNEDSSFHRLFISFHASLYGFKQGCRPLLFLDSILLKSKYQGTFLAATAADGDDGVFPVAFAVVDRESDENWHWFLLQLKTALAVCSGLTFVADREKGLKNSIDEIFQDDEVYHGFCLRYLTEQFTRAVEGHFSHEVKRLMVEDFYAAAHAPLRETFHRCVDRIKHISPQAYDWVLQSEPEHWANAYFMGARYNNMTSNFGELFYGWVSEVHELPITQMVDAIRTKIMELFCARQTNSMQWLSRLTPSMEEKLVKETLKGQSLQVLISTGNRFEVRGDTIETVDVDNCDCTCKSWQLTGLPCCHAIAVISGLRRDVYDYCSRYFTTDSYRLTYTELTHPISDVDCSLQKDSDLQLAVTVNPPATRRPPGRPTKGVCSRVRKRQLQCSRCKGTGHNKSSCKELLLEC